MKKCGFIVTVHAALGINVQKVEKERFKIGVRPHTKCANIFRVNPFLKQQTDS